MVPMALAKGQQQEVMTKVMRKNATVNTPVSIDGTPLADVQEFVYLGSKMTADGDCDVEMNVRINKANQAFAMLNSVWDPQTCDCTPRSGSTRAMS